MAMGERSRKLRLSAGRSRHESRVAAGRLRKSKRSCSPAIPMSPACAWRCRIGRRSFGLSNRVNQMRPRLYHRLKKLEVESARIRGLRGWREQEADLEKARSRVRLFLRIRGVEQNETESMMDAFARALGVGNRELRSQMLAGIDPIKKWFTEDGVFEEIARRKAAGTWPAAGGCNANVRL